MAVAKTELIDKVTEIVDQAGRRDGIEAVDVQWIVGKSRILRIYIDKPDGVTHGDCEHISRTVDAALDAENLVDGAPYTLEVSSPGVERKLSALRDFERFTGHPVKLVLREPLEGLADRGKCFEGTLTAFSDGILTLAPANAEPVRIPFDLVERANLKFVW